MNLKFALGVLGVLVSSLAQAANKSVVCHGWLSQNFFKAGGLSAAQYMGDINKFTLNPYQKKKLTIADVTLDHFRTPGGTWVGSDLEGLEIDVYWHGVWVNEETFNPMLTLGVTLNSVTLSSTNRRIPEYSKIEEDVEVYLTIDQPARGEIKSSTITAVVFCSKP